MAIDTDCKKPFSGHKKSTALSIPGQGQQSRSLTMENTDINGSAKGTPSWTDIVLVDILGLHGDGGFANARIGERVCGWRPTLPSIHTLDLPLLARPTHPNVKYEFQDNARYSPLTTHTNKHHYDRKVSTSSSRTSSPSPPPNSPVSDSDLPYTPDASPSPTTKFRLVPCPLETADAIIFIPPPGAPRVPHAPNYVPRHGTGQGVLLVGSSWQHLRNPQRPLAKGARIHPYRIVRGENTTKSRRSSVVSITAFSATV
ncbi:hypothetical protein BDZ97DRAFT_1922213 [Flammula alnicola]|nr:hypothetical protein BDZ97DRAFT_1922213 [Flammula alnicola]